MHSDDGNTTHKEGTQKNWASDNDNDNDDDC